MGYAPTLQRHRHGCFITALFIIIIASSTAAQTPAESRSESPLEQELKMNPGMLAEFGQLVEKLQHNVQLPPPRGQSRLLPLLPKSTIFYGAFPNYGDAAHQVQVVFDQEVKDSPALRTWWTHGELAVDGPKLEESLEEIYQFSQYLGDEIVISGSTEGRKDPSFLILAEVRKPGLKDFLQRMTKQLADKTKSPVRIFDKQDLLTAKDTGAKKELVILVRPDFVIGAGDVATLRSFNAQLDRHTKEFASTPFAQRLKQAYTDGTTVVAGVDVQKILSQFPPEDVHTRTILQHTGFADTKYLIWERKSVSGQSTNQMELSFTGPRQGAASWLAAPGPMGSLDFGSPKATLVGTVLLKDPAEIFEDVKELSTTSNPNALASIAQMEQALKLSLKDDLLGLLGGEMTLEVDTVVPTNPIWKAILRVKDPERLQATFNTLLAVVPVGAHQFEDGGVIYHTLQVPSARKPVEIVYTFVDGYLIIASSRETITEAIRLHRTGESLAKSTKFLAALPQSPSSEVSALLFEDPISMTALSLRQVMPEIAESLKQNARESAPTVIYAKGEESAIREVSRSGGVDVTSVLVMAAIAIPNLLRARVAANESSAVGTIRSINTAQIAYAATYRKGFARDLATLGPNPNGASTPSSLHAGMIDAPLGNASCTAGSWCTKSGFRFMISPACKRLRCDEYVVVGTFENSTTGLRSFCSTSDAVIRFKIGPPLTSPLSLSECREWTPLQ
jgi:type IV pilus assembly protein PilA